MSKAVCGYVQSCLQTCLRLSADVPKVIRRHVQGCPWMYSRCLPSLTLLPLYPLAPGLSYPCTLLSFCSFTLTSFSPLCPSTFHLPALAHPTLVLFHWFTLAMDVCKVVYWHVQGCPWTCPRLSVDMFKTVHRHVQGCLQMCQRVSTDVSKIVYRHVHGYLQTCPRLLIDMPKAVCRYVQGCSQICPRLCTVMSKAVHVSKDVYEHFQGSPQTSQGCPWMCPGPLHPPTLLPLCPSNLAPSCPCILPSLYSPTLVPPALQPPNLVSSCSCALSPSCSYTLAWFLPSLSVPTMKSMRARGFKGCEGLRV